MPATDQKGQTLEGALARLQCELWWRRSLRAAVSRQLETDARKAGRVHRHAGIYVSDQAVGRRRDQRKRNRELLACMEAVNELGESFSLEELQTLSVSNPYVRRSELMARISGFEIIAQTCGDIAEFYTISCPSRMRCRYARSGKAIPNSYGGTPADAQRYLCAQWAKARAQFQRLGVRVYGVRVAEPHHDGTPHWHLLLFMSPPSRAAVRETLQRYALEHDGDEPGASKHRFRIEAINPDKGMAVGYIAKYISKNIDGHRIEADEYGTPAEKAAERIEAWASVWRIRQFQQIGGPPVSVWRELRRADGAPEGLLSEACNAADSGKWADFVMLMRGPQVTRKEIPVRLAKVWSDEPGRYGEPVGYSVFGVTAGAITLTTRFHKWTIEKRGERADRGELNESAACATAPMHAPQFSAHLAAQPPLEFCQ